MSSSNILDYIPQRPPFVMVDRFVKTEEAKTITSFEIKQENLFSENGVFFESGIIENIAQTVAAGAGYQQRKSEGKPKIGVIGSVRKLKIAERPKVGQVLETQAEVISEFGSAVVVKGLVKCNNKEIASCQMNIFIMDSPDTLNE